MPRADRPPRRLANLVLALVLLDLAVAGALAYQVRAAIAEMGRQPAQVLHQYAAIAAWELAGRAERAARDELATLVQPSLRAAARAGDGIVTPLLPPAHRLRPPFCECPRPLAARAAFRLRLADGALGWRDDLPADARTWIAGPLLAEARALAAQRGDADFALATARLPSGRAVAVYGIATDGAGAPVAAYGVLTDTVALVRRVARAVADRELLPRALAGTPADERLLAVRLVDRDGAPLYGPARPDDAVAVAREPLGAAGGGLVAEVRLRPAAYAALVPTHRRGGAVVLLSALLAAGVCGTVLAVVGVRRVERLAELRADFVANVSHELRTPLAQIALSAETLRLGRERSTEERARFLDVIAREADRLRALVERVLAFSALERRAPRLAREPTELGELARDVADAFALHAPPGVAIAVAADDAVWAEADRDAFRQILGNLLDNALKHGPERQTVTVSVRAVASARGPRALVIVDDAGEGIPPGDRRRVFAPYARLDRAERAAIAGSGLGLTVVDRLVRAHGGRVRVDDAPGGGARLVVELPGLAVDGDPAPPERDAVRAER